jgi:transcriptional regulator of acetoin/glycerol metabolism
MKICGRQPSDEAFPRSEIHASWERCRASALHPSGTFDLLPVQQRQEASALVQAASSVLDGLQQEIAGTSYFVTLADAEGTLLDRRLGRPQLAERLDAVGGVVGRRFSERVSGTNSISLVLELGQQAQVIGAEHYLEQFKDFACYGHPVNDPSSGRMVGVLNLACLVEQASALGPPFLRRIAEEIERGLLDGVGEHSREFPHASGPDGVLAKNFAVTKSTATDPLSTAGSATFDDVRPAGGPARRYPFRLGSEPHTTAAVTKVRLVDDVLVESTPEPAGSDRQRELVERASRSVSSPQAGNRLTRYREQRLSVLVAGERGTGRTAAVRQLAGDEPITVVDLSSDPGRPGCARPDGLSRSRAGLTVIDNVDLLDRDRVMWVVRLLEADTHWIAVTSKPAVELEGVHRDLLARCVGRFELAALRDRAHELPTLIADRLAAVGAAGRLRFSAEAIQALSAHPWLGNFPELHDLLDHLVRSRLTGEITVGDLPEPFRRTPAKRPRGLVEKTEYDLILQALRVCGGNRAQAARRLGISRSTLHRRLRSFGLAA